MFKLTATSLVAVLAATVAAQSIPKYQSFPAACASQCASTIETSDLCYKEYTTGQDIVSCFCSGAPSSSEVSTCSSCLSSNGASELAGVLSAIPDACATYTKTCQKECGFDTCASSDIACQCSESYLASIYQCASCNTRNGNTGATGLTDYEALANSCGNQNFTVPATTSSALPSPTGQASYSAPSLAASASSYSMGASSVTGFAISADGTTTTVAVSSTPSVRASSVSSASSGAVSAASSSARASSSSAASASSARASSSAASGSAIPAAATAPASGALALGVNAVGMIGAMFGMVAVL